MAIRSWNIQRTPTVQPWSISPIRSASGTRTSVMNSWQNSRLPLSISMRCTSTPARSIGSMNTVRPRCFGVSQLVRARQSAQSDHQAPVVQIFEPLSTHSSPSRTALVSAAATSEPPLGSERSCIQISSPFRMAGRCRSFCSSVPKSSSTAAHGDIVGDCSRDGYS
jgi:hypothetical protein